MTQKKIGLVLTISSSTLQKTNRNTNRLDTIQLTPFIFPHFPEEWTEACKPKCMDDAAASSMKYTQLKATQFSSVSQTPPLPSLHPPFPSLLASPSAPIFTCCCHQGNRQFKQLLLSNGRQYPASSWRENERERGRERGRDLPVCQQSVIIAQQPTMASPTLPTPIILCLFAGKTGWP